MTVKKLIDSYEDARKEESFNELFENRPITVRMSFEDVAFMQAVADYYRQSRSALAQNLLESALDEVFASIPESSIMQIAESADAIFRKDAAKNAADQGGTFEICGYSKWLGLAKLRMGGFGEGAQ